MALLASTTFLPPPPPCTPPSHKLASYASTHPPTLLPPPLQGTEKGELLLIKAGNFLCSLDDSPNDGVRITSLAALSKGFVAASPEGIFRWVGGWGWADGSKALYVWVGRWMTGVLYGWVGG
jgi:hypothetical protein